MKLITNKKQKEIDAMIIKKLRFVARATLESLAKADTIPSNDLKKAMDIAEQVFYADDVI